MEKSGEGGHNRLIKMPAIPPNRPPITVPTSRPGPVPVKLKLMMAPITEKAGINTLLNLSNLSHLVRVEAPLPAGFFKFAVFYHNSILTVYL